MDFDFDFDLDLLANLADMVAIPIGLYGLYLVLNQLKVGQQESEKEHQRRQNEMTLNAYNIVRGDLRETIRRVRKKLELEDMFDEFKEGHLDKIMSDKELRDDVAKMLGFLNKFAVGIKYDVFNVDLVNDLAGKLFIKTYKQFKPYIHLVRKDSNTFYIEYEKLVMNLMEMQEHSGLK